LQLDRSPRVQHPDKGAQPTSSPERTSKKSVAAPFAALEGLRIQSRQNALALGAGIGDAQKTLLASPWLAPMPPEIGGRTFDVLRHNPVERSQSLLQAPHSNK
jgi:hypothetical protein